MDRMNKEKLLKLIETLKIDKSEFWLLSTSALVMRGICSEASDLDIAVTDKGLEQLRRRYNLRPKGDGFYIVTDKVDCVCDGAIDKLKYKPELIDGYLCQNIQEYLGYLKASDKEKDKQRVPIVEAYINNVDYTSKEAVSGDS